MEPVTSYLPSGLPAPAAEPDGLDQPYWTGLRENQLRVQCCASCATWRWGPEWLCHACHSFEIDWRTVAPEGIVYSGERVWHPVHAALAGHMPYRIVLVELPHAGGVRMVGNLLGDPHAPVVIGARVKGVFEHHDHGERAYTLLNWRIENETTGDAP